MLDSVVHDLLFSLRSSISGLPGNFCSRRNQMKTFVRFIFIFAALFSATSSLSGCGTVRKYFEPKTEAIGDYMNDSVELLDVKDANHPGVLYRVPSGSQTPAFRLDVSVEILITWLYPDGRVYRQYRFSPNDKFKDTKDIYGIPIDFVARASGRNDR